MNKETDCVNSIQPILLQEKKHLVNAFPSAPTLIPRPHAVNSIFKISHFDSLTHPCLDSHRMSSTLYNCLLTDLPVSIFLLLQFDFSLPDEFFLNQDILHLQCFHITRRVNSYALSPSNIPAK